MLSVCKNGLGSSTGKGWKGSWKGRIDTELTEVKEFATNIIQGCDEDGAGALEWKEVKNCEVNKRHFLKKISTKISPVHQTLNFCAH